MKHALKPISLSLVLCFSLQQLVLAADPRQLLIDAKMAFMEEEARKGAMSSYELEEAQALAQSAVDAQNDLYELSQNHFSLTTENGDILDYVGDTLKKITRADGTQLKNIHLDENGFIGSADIRLMDGTVQIFDQGQILAYEAPDGTQVFFESGKVTKIIQGDLETLYSYTYDDQGRLIGTTLDNVHTSNSYDALGKLQQVHDKAARMHYFFDGGILQRIEAGDGLSAVFSHTQTDSSVVVGLSFLRDGMGNTLTTEQITSYDSAWVDALEFSELIYTSEGQISEVHYKNGSVAFFNQDGLYRQVDAQGQAIEISAQKSSLGNILTSRITQNGLESVYDAQGNLSEVTLDGMRILFRNATVDAILKEDGTKIVNILFDAQGHIQDCVVFTPDGQKRTYKDNHLVRVEDATDVVLDYIYDPELQKSILSAYTTSSDLIYHFSYTPEGLAAATLDDSFIPEADMITLMDFDAQMRLTRALKADLSITEYLQDGKIAQIIPASDEPMVFTYHQDGSYAVSQGAKVSLYDAAGHLQKVTLQDEGRYLEVLYAYDRIRQIYRLDPDTQAQSLLFEYTYEGAKTFIRDLKENSLRTYENDRLLSIFDIANSVLSAYSYFSDDSSSEDFDKVQSVQVSRFGRALHSYQYSYANDMTLVADELGVIRSYSADNKLRRLSSGGEIYAYEYFTQEDGSQLIEETLTEKTLSNGARAQYDNGEISQVLLSDGTLVTNIDIRDGAISQMAVVENSGQVSIFDAQGLKSRLLSDGSMLDYDNLRLSKATLADGSAWTYTYTDDGRIRATSSNYSTTFIYNAQGALLAIQLPNVDSPQEVEAQATHTYIGGANGSYSHDTDQNTAQTQGLGWLFSEHYFQEAQDIQALSYKLTAFSNSNGNTNNGSEARSYVQVLNAQTNQWVTVPETYLYQSHSNGGGGGSTANASTNGLVTKTVDIKNILGVRAVTQATAYQNGSGNIGGYSAIWEIDYTLADLSIMNFNGSGFDGPRFDFVYDAQGTLVGAPSSFQSIASSFEHKLTDIASLAYFDQRTAAIPSEFGAWKKDVESLSLDVNLITLKEYSSDGTLEAQAKADGNVTVFMEVSPGQNKAYRVYDRDGQVLIEYDYDTSGNLIGVHLKSARQALPIKMQEARLTLENARRDQLLELARQKNLAYQSIEAQANTQEELIQIQIHDLLSQKDSVSSAEARGRQARNQKADALQNLDEAIAQAQGTLTGVYASEADAYQALDSQIQQISSSIQTSFETASNALDQQEAALKYEILKQEASPVIYDAYRRILGRDPSSQEYSQWIDKLDYETGQYIVSERTYYEIKNGASLDLSKPGDYITLKDSDDFDFEGDFTLEFNFKANDLSWWQMIYDNADYYSGGLMAQLKHDQIEFGFNSEQTSSLVLNHNFSNNTWYHLALSRKDGLIRIFVDGQQIGQYAYSAAIRSTRNQDLYLGAFLYNYNNALYSVYNGYMDGLRIEHKALYETNFTYDATLQSFDSNTKLYLFNRDGVYQDLTGRHTLQYANGASTSFAEYRLIEKIKHYEKELTDFVPYLTDTLLALPELGDRQFYVQNIKDRVNAQIQSYLSKDQSARQSFAALLGLSASELIALSEADATRILDWVNSRGLHFGQSAFLSLESILDQKGISYAREDIAEKAILIDILTGVISPLDDGDLVISMYALDKVASLYGATLDAATLSWDDLRSVYEKSAPVVEEQEVPTYQPGQSVNFDGSGDMLTVPDSEDFNFSNKDFTIDFNVKLNSTGYQVLYCQETNGTNYSYLYTLNGNLYYYAFSNNAVLVSVTATNVLSTGQWANVALQRKGKNFELYVNGIKKASVSSSATIPNYTGPLTIGALNTASANYGYYLNGSIDGFRVSKGIKRYTGNFTPPTQRYEDDSYTKLLLYASNSQIKDESSAHKVITLAGDAKANSANEPSQFITFDGNGDTIRYADSSDWDFGTGDWTVETWVNWNTVQNGMFFNVGTNNFSVYYYNNALYIGHPAVDTLIRAFTPVAGRWYHIAFQRLNGKEMVFVNGQKLGADVPNSHNINFTDPAYVGSYMGASNFINGKIDGLRVSKGVARYSSNFTPPTTRFTADEYTKLLLYVDAAQIKDYSGSNKVGTLLGNTSTGTSYKLDMKVITLQKVITRYPVTITDPSTLTQEQKNDIMAHPEKYNPRIIAHINGNHYVIVTAITENSITYIDPGVGADKQNEQITVTKEAFMKAWQGHVLGTHESLQLAPGYQTKVMSAQQAQSVRGAFWGSFLGFIGGILSFIPGLNFLAPIFQAISAVVSAIEGDFISAITSLASFGLSSLSNIGNFFQGTFSGIKNSLGALGTVFGAAGNFVKTIYNSVTGFVSSVTQSFDGFLKGALGVTSKTAANISRSVVSLGVNFAVSKGLDALGLSPELTSLFGSLASGAMVGAFRTPEATQAVKVSQVVASRTNNIISSMQQTLTLNRIGQLGLELGLDSQLTNIIGLSLSAIQGHISEVPGSTLAEAFSFVKPQLLSSLAQYGIGRLGNVLGLENNLGKLISTSVFDVASGFYQAIKDTGYNLMQNISTALQENVVRYSVDLLGQSHPMLGSLFSEDILSKLELSINRNGLFGTISGLFSNTLNLVQGSITSLFSLVSQKGLFGALESIIGSLIGNVQTRELIYQSGGLQNFVNQAPTSEVTLISGQQAQEVQIDANTYLYFQDGQLVAKKEQGLLQIGSFGIDSLGHLALIDGKRYDDQDGYVINTAFLDGRINNIDISQEGQSIIRITENNEQALSFDNSYAYTQDWISHLVNGVVEWVSEGVKFVFRDGVATQIQQTVSSTVDSLSKIKFLFGNGFENEYRPENTHDPLLKSYVQDLMFRQIPAVIDIARTYILDLYEQTKLLGNAIDWLTDFGMQSTALSDQAKALINLLKTEEDAQQLLYGWVDDGSDFISETMRGWLSAWRDKYKALTGLGNNLVQETITEINKAGSLDDAIAFVHSGATAPILTAIEQEQYNVDTVLIYEGPHPNYSQQFTNPNLRRIIHVMGSNHGLLDSMLEGDAPVPFLGWANFSNPANSSFENINIEIKGAFHSDYSYDERYWTQKIEDTYNKYKSQGDAIASIFVDKVKQDQERNRKVNLFMRELYERALTDQVTPGRLEDFLRRTAGITYSSLNKFATVDINILNF